MTNELRKSGIDAVGDIPWGTHFCHFHENKTDLLEVLVSYFKAGLEQNEFCVWGVFDPIDEQAAGSALGLALPGACARLAAGDIEILPQSRWSLREGVQDLGYLVRDLETKLDKALARGYAGMRVNMNAVWWAARSRRDLDAYEDELSALIAHRRIIMLCAYPFQISRAAEILNAGYTHRFAVARQHGRYQVVETPDLKHARAEVKRLIAKLVTADIERTQEAADRDRADEALRASDARSACYFQLGLVGMALVSPTRGCIEVNDRFCAILGYQRHELMQMTWAALVHPDDLADDIASYNRLVAAEVDGFQIEKRWIRKGGDVVHTNLSLGCQRREDGSIDYLAMMVEDLTRPGPAPREGAAGDGELRPGTPPLSSREIEVARLIGSGRTVKEIAAELVLSGKTVSTYRTRILTKLKLKSTAQLIRYALKNHLAE